ncbi:AtpZ/AtpI family protein [Cocleimonas flava]|jgi:ATP synthase protein I|uniref:ATP synthase protein I n=2 Tax=Cocleimonas flava TaxID=634765 RepID=A0A4R1F179_9GAMM|nr:MULTISPECIES: AtpZ/AtpI family protein [unclassified Cocleimonas]MEB8434376.1 AtpZ/AtpI family protein [Cocleimonas sp. KMM 6892]MEC4717221.1 AtpZ/AtpI family protein [Cocleimonas sp. KMM 6895]MEC4746600.1 AtpZ/AtpI family protein [Cocleimonas sp. KMM 6896]TCJ87603.1 ATP synthase protein I [Cocleimonas flava]
MANQKPKPQEHFEKSVDRKADLKLRAQREKNHSVWFGLGMFGLVGWAVVVPTLIGVALGVWIDKHWPGPVSWTLNLLIIGLIAGCINAWVWVKKESNNDD